MKLFLSSHRCDSAVPPVAIQNPKKHLIPFVCSRITLTPMLLSILPLQMSDRDSDEFSEGPAGLGGDDESPPPSPKDFVDSSEDSEQKKAAGRGRGRGGKSKATIPASGRGRAQRVTRSSGQAAPKRKQVVSKAAIAKKQKLIEAQAAKHQIEETAYAEYLSKAEQVVDPEAMLRQQDKEILKEIGTEMPQFLDRTAEGDKSAQAEKLKGLVEMIGGTAAPLQTGEEVEKRKRLAGPTDKDSDEEDVQPTKRRKTKKELAEEKEARKKEVKIEIEALG